MAQLLDELVKNVNKKYKEKMANGEDSTDIMMQGVKNYDYERIPFTSPRMNYCTYGGLPVGKIIEFFGEEHGGKTTSALDIVANFQNMFPDKEVLWVDAENTLDVEWAMKLGVDVNRLYLVKPQAQSAEDIFNIIEDAVETGEVGLWVLDSLGVLVSSMELDEKRDYEDKVYGGISLPLTRFSKKIEMFMQRTKCTGIGINQMRDDMNSAWGGQKTPGGKAWRHCCAVRLQFSRGKFIDEKGNELTRNASTPVGNIVMMSMVKNKTCKPDRRTGQYTLNYDTGIDYIKDLVDVAITYDIIDKHGAWFTIVDPYTGEVLKEKIQGQASVNALLEEDTELLEKVEQFIDRKIQE